MAFSDENGYDVVQFSNGHVKTKNFDSSKIGNIPFLLHIVTLGQSLGNGTNGNDTTVLPKRVDSSKAFMFARIKTFDMGYNFGASLDEYNANQDYYDNLLYKDVRPLTEEIGYGASYQSKWWDSAAYARCETPSTGIVEGILNMCKENGMNDTPFYTLSTNASLGGTYINVFMEGGDVFERCIKDIKHGFSLANKIGLGYRVVLVFMQGENDLSRATSKEDYKESFKSMFNSYKKTLNDIGVDGNIKIYTYQPYCANNYKEYSKFKQGAALALMELNNENTWFKMCYPNYNLKHNPGDKYIHLFKESYRKLGNSIGYAIFSDIYGEFETIKIDYVERNDNTLIVKFNKEFVIDKEHYENEDSYDSTLTDIKEKYYGFAAIDENGNNVITSINIIDSMTMRIICGNMPIAITYGYDSIEGTGVTCGGYVREAKVNKGYNNETNVYLYMPTQRIDNFVSKHIYTATNGDGNKI